MKKLFLFIIGIFFSLTVFGAHVFYLHSRGDVLEDEKCSDLDTLRFIDGQAIFFMEGGDKMVYGINVIDSLSFDEIISATDTVFVTYQDGQAPQVINPFKNEIDVTIENGGVFVNCHAQLENVVYSLSGTTQNGYFHIESERKFTLQLNNLNMASQGVLAPIRSFAGSSMMLDLKGKNNLSDALADTCNAVLRSKGQIIVGGSGELSVVANSKRAIQSGDFIEINAGSINVIAPYDDAIKVNDYFVMNDGALFILGNGIKVERGYMVINGGSINYANTDLESVYIPDAKGFKCDGDTLLPISPENGTVTINGGLITFDVGGEVSRFIRCSGDAVINGGMIQGTLYSYPYYDSALKDVSYQCIIKADGKIKMLGGVHDMTVAKSSIGGRGLVADGEIIFDGGVKLNLNMECDPYVNRNDKLKPGYGLKTDLGLTMRNCDVNIICSAAEVGAISVASSDLEINDGAKVQLASYSNYFSMIGNNGSIKLNGGQMITISPSCTDATEISPAGGVMISLGLTSYGNHYIPSSVYSAIKYTASAGTAIKIATNVGQDKLVYQLPTSINSLTSGNVYMYIFGPYEKNVEHILYSGGTISGGVESNGIYQGATYTGGTGISFTPKANVVEVK